jgi:peptidoglycan/LPS O-acetylase OafA/YrhL
VGLLVASVGVGPTLVPRYRDTIGFAVEPPLMGLLMVQVVALSGRAPWTWLEWPVVKFLGRISYSLYLYQQLTVWTTSRLLSSSPLVIQLAGVWAVTIVAAAGSYYVIEAPFLRLKDRWFTRPSAASQRQLPQNNALMAPAVAETGNV